MKALMVVDYQNGFVDGSLGFSGAEKLDDGIAENISSYMKNGDVVIVTMDTHGSADVYLQSREGRALPVPHCEENSEDWQLFGKTGKLIAAIQSGTAPDELYKGILIIVKKPTFGSDAETLRSMLSAKDIAPENISEVKFVGLVANICVISNICVVQGMLPEAQMVLDAALTDSFDKQKYVETLSVAEGIQVHVENKPNIYVVHCPRASTLKAGCERKDDVYSAFVAAGNLMATGYAEKAAVVCSHKPGFELVEMDWDTMVKSYGVGGVLVNS